MMEALARARTALARPRMTDLSIPEPAVPERTNTKRGVSGPALLLVRGIVAWP